MPNIAEENKVKILIGDNGKDFGMTCADLFRQQNFYVTTRAKNPESILKALESTDFDLVIVDAGHNSLDVLNLLIECKSKFGEDMPKFLVISAVDSPGYTKQLMENGATYFLLKPFDITTLVKIAINLTMDDQIKALNALNATLPDMELVVTDLIHQLGVPAHIKGYHFLREAILLCLTDNAYLDAVTKKLYPAVGTKFITTPSRVERAIRHAIEIAWDRGNIDVLQEYFGYTINTQKGKPTNSEFIALLVDKIRLQYRNYQIA
jgi:two-component system response regulator (stage 0 sporulation protein A)